MDETETDDGVMLERAACDLTPVRIEDCNPNCTLPYGLEVDHVWSSLNDWIEFLCFINTQLNGRGIERLEAMLMPANFSSMVGEFMSSAIPKHCPTLARNNYHNGHPDLVPVGKYPRNAIQYAEEGIEIKSSRYDKGWQGHNPEESWMLIFVFGANAGPRDTHKGIDPRPFAFKKVLCAKLEKEDWSFAGRNEGSRRTPTASILRSGFEKLEANWVYRAPDAD